MNYLFYDLEFASQSFGKSKICEFGYVITDEKFNILERSNYIINPDIPNNQWDWYVVKNILKRERKEYLKSKTFDNYYVNIKKLFDKADYVFGHSLNGDAQALNDELQRYHLPPINYEFYDVKLFYKNYSNARRDISVSDILIKLSIEGDQNAHDAEVDSYNTMLELKEMLNKLEVNLEELIQLCNMEPDKSHNYKVESIEMSRQRKVECAKQTSDGTNEIKKYGLNKKRFLQFLDNIKPAGSGKRLLKGKKVSISMNYECEHYRQMLNIIQLIVNEGGEYVLKGSLSNIFVRYDELTEDGSLRKCSRLNYVTKAIEEGSQIEIMQFDDFLEIFGLTEKDLDEMPLPSLDFLFNKNANIKSRSKKESKSDAVCELGDFFGNVNSKEGDNQCLKKS